MKKMLGLGLVGMLATMAAAVVANIPTNPSPSIFFIASSPFRFRPACARRSFDLKKNQASPMPRIGRSRPFQAHLSAPVENEKIHPPRRFRLLPTDRQRY